MKTLYEGEKRNVGALVSRRSGAGAIALVSPERRILDANKNLVAGFDWAAAVWDSGTSKIFALFDSTVGALSAVGVYYVQLRGTVGAERYVIQIAVKLVDLGP